MRLDLRDIIHVPNGSKPFQLQLELSELEFYGERPIQHPVRAEGAVTNHAGALVLEGEAVSELELCCDRCGQRFSREKRISLNTLLAQELEQEDNDDIVLLDGTELDLDEYVSASFILALDTKNLCSDNCKGLCARCGSNLNLGPCGCKPEVDPRFAALAQLLGDETE